MKITMHAMGSRGDVQPLVALGKGLKAAGHAITIVTHQEFEPLVRLAGVSFSLLRGLDPKQSMQTITGEARQHPLRQHKMVQSIRLTQLLKVAIPDIGESYWEATQRADLCITNLIPPGVAPSVAEKLGIPCLFAILQPMEPTSAFPNVLVSGRSWGKRGNRLTYSGISLLLWGVLRSHVNRWRRQHLSLPPLGWTYLPEIFRSQGPRLYGFSPSVLPKPPEWSDHAVITGYWFLDQTSDWSPPQALTSFLDSGPPPISIGFGSMIADDKGSIADICIQALALTQQRGIFLTGWGGLPRRDLPESMLAIESAPHEWLFPHVAAVVHHGGAGTTASGLRNGVPTVIVPFMTDQPFWGQKVYELGVGPKPIPRHRLTVERLANAITEAVTNPAIRSRAAELGRKIRAEDGIGNVVDVIERFMAHRANQ